MARPKKTAGTTKGRFLQVRVDGAEKAVFDRAAKEAGLDTSAWVRTRLREAARKELESLGEKVSFTAGKKTNS